MTGHVARMKEGRSVFKIVTGTRKPTGKRPLERLGVDGRAIIEWILIINTRNQVGSSQGWDYWRALVNAALSFRVS